MQPPTPTMIPVGNPDLPLDVPTYNLWDFAPEAVQRWNQIPPAVTVVLQALVILVIVSIGYVLLIRFLRNLSNESVPTEE